MFLQDFVHRTGIRKFENLRISHDRVVCHIQKLCIPYPSRADGSHTSQQKKWDDHLPIFWRDMIMCIIFKHYELMRVAINRLKNILFNTHFKTIPSRTRLCLSISSFISFFLFRAASWQWQASFHRFWLGGKSWNPGSTICVHVYYTNIQTITKM